MIFDGFIFGVSFLPCSTSLLPEGCAMDTLKKNNPNKLKAATNKDLKPLDAIPS